jgi:predicted metal-binding protein
MNRPGHDAGLFLCGCRAGEDYLPSEYTYMPHQLKSYPPTWKGDLLLACRKCQNKLKGEASMRELVKLKKTIKRQNKENPDNRLHLIGVPCMDLCPKGAVTICLPAKKPTTLSLLRSEGDVEKLYPRP